MERHTRSGARAVPVIRATGTTQGRNPTEAEAQRRYRRHGPHGRPGSPQLIWRAPPVNGRPFKPYVYHGCGPYADEETW